MPSRDRDHARDVAREAMIPRPGDAYPRDVARRAGAHAKPARPQGAQLSLVSYLAVLICVAAGISIAWNQGSHGGGLGGVIAGGALLAAALLRLMLPARLAGLLAVRNRATDAVTLIVLGACLLATGLVLPGLQAAVRTRDFWRPAEERETRKCRRSR